MVARPSPQIRLVAEILDSVLLVVTLFAGWLIWFALIAGRGQTPAKALLRIAIHDSATGQIASRKQVWLREIGWKWVIPFLVSLILSVLSGEGLASAILSIYYLAGALSVVLDSGQRAIWDHLSGTDVRKVRTGEDGYDESWVVARQTLDDLMPSRRTPIR